MFALRVSDDVRATRLASKLMRFCVSGDALETMRAAPPEPPATTMLNAPLGVFSMGAPLVSSGRNCICPEICCSASRCRLPMGRAFAVKGTSNMDSRVVGGVHWAGFRSASRSCRIRVRIATAVRQRSGRRAVPLVWNCVAVSFEHVDLRASQRPRICSEADVRHGCGGDMQRSPDGSHDRRPMPWRRRLPSL